METATFENVIVLATITRPLGVTLSWSIIFIALYMLIFFLWFSLSVTKNFKTNQVFPLNLLKSLIQFDINQNSLYFVLFQVQRHFIVTIHCTIEMKYQTLVLLYWIESITLILMQAYCWNSLHVCENKLIQYIRR